MYIKLPLCLVQILLPLTPNNKKLLKGRYTVKKNVRFSRPLARMSSTPWSKNNVIIQGVLDILTGDGQTTHFFTVYNMRCRKLFEKNPLECSTRYRTLHFLCLIEISCKKNCAPSPFRILFFIHCILYNKV